MNWREEAVQRLSDYRYVRNSIRSMQNQIKQLQMEAEGIKSRSFDQISVPGNAGRREDRLLNNLVCRQQLEQAVEQADLWVQITDQALQSLMPEDKQLLDQIYIQGERANVTDIAAQMGMERSTIYRRKDEALRRFTVALYGVS